MPSTMNKPVIRTACGNLLTLDPDSENPVSVEEVVRRRDAWLARNRDKLAGYSTEKFIEEKRRHITRCPSR